MSYIDVLPREMEVGGHSGLRSAPGFHTTNLQYAKLKDQSLRGADLPGVKFTMADLSGADLSGANLQQCHFHRARMQGMTAVGANFQQSDLTQAQCGAANFTGANLSEADLNHADFADAILARANLYGVRTGRGGHAARCQTNLRGADLRGADLRGAHYDAATRWPLSWDLPQDALIFEG